MKTPNATITDPAALALLTTERVEAYLRAKGWESSPLSAASGYPVWGSPLRASTTGTLMIVLPEPLIGHLPIVLDMLARFESRSQLDVWAEILGLRVVIVPEGA